MAWRGAVLGDIPRQPAALDAALKDISGTSPTGLLITGDLAMNVRGRQR